MSLSKLQTLDTVWGQHRCGNSQKWHLKFKDQKPEEQESAKRGDCRRFRRYR